MSDASAPLRPDAVAAALRSGRYGRSLRVVAQTASTNDDARADALADAPDGHVVTAEAQSSGRGSHGRSWSSPAGTDLYVSIVDRPAVPFDRLPPLTLAVGLGVADTVGHFLAGHPELSVRIKWPNDVWVGGRKCAGILVETSAAPGSVPAVVIGVGLNVNRTQFPEELGGLATSMRLAAGGTQPFDRNAVLARMLSDVERWVDRFVSGGSAPIAAAVQERLLLRDELVRCGDVRGRLLGVTASGAISIETAEGPREVVAGRLTALDGTPKEETR